MEEKIKALIKDYFKNESIHLISSHYRRFLKDNPDIEDVLNDILKEVPEWESIKHIIYSVVHSITLPKCKKCR